MEVSHECSSLGYSTVYLLHSLQYIYSIHLHCMSPKLLEQHRRGSKCDGAGSLLFLRDLLFIGILFEKYQVLMWVQTNVIKTTHFFLTQIMNQYADTWKGYFQNLSYLIRTMSICISNNGNRIHDQVRRKAVAGISPNYIIIHSKLFTGQTSCPIATGITDDLAAYMWLWFTFLCNSIRLAS